jgi:SnoaL-like domain
MSTTTERSDGAIARRELRAAMEARDHGRVEALLAEDVALWSPIIGYSFDGKQAVSALYAAVIESFERYHYTHELGSGDEQLLAFRGTVRGREMDGCDLIRVNDDGLIAEIIVFVRPMAGIATLARELGPRLARRRGRLAWLAMRLLTPPLPLLLRMVDAIAPRLIPLR